MTSLYPYSFASAIVPNGQSLSQGVSLGGKQLVGLLMPTVWTSDASVTFKGSLDGTNWFDIYDFEGNEVTVTAAHSRLISLANMIGAPFMKIQSGTTASAVNQGQASTVVLVLVTPLNI